MRKDSLIHKKGSKKARRPTASALSFRGTPSTSATLAVSKPGVVNLNSRATMALFTLF
jgi:hypothetical protein